jgi:AbrB family looped-hinge helix DNA binding protein
MNDKGQVAIPAEARAELKLEPGARLMIMRGPLGGGVIIVKTEIVEEQMKTWSTALAAPQINNPDEEE